MISYFLFVADDGTIGVGHVFDYKKSPAKDQLEDIIRKETDSPYACLISKVTDFKKESEQYDSLEDYIKSVIGQF